MYRLTINYRHGLVPPHVMWFILGWGHFEFKVNNSMEVYPATMGDIAGKHRAEVLWGQAYNISNQINMVINNNGGLAATIEAWVAKGYLVWSEVK